jgi:hypothetical protein
VKQTITWKLATFWKEREFWHKCDADIQKVGLTDDRGNAPWTSREQSAQGSKGGEEQVGDGAKRRSKWFIPSFYLPSRLGGHLQAKMSIHFSVDLNFRIIRRHSAHLIVGRLIRANFW